MKRILTLLILVSIVFYSCDKTGKTDVSSKETNPTPVSKNTSSPLVQQYKLLKGDVDQAWGYLEKIEDDKFFTMNRLLEEISFNPRHKNNRIIEEKNKIEQLKSSRLTLTDFEDLNHLDAYDLKSDSTINSLYQLVEETKDMDKFPLAEDLLNDLDSLNNNSTISLRAYYGEVAENYNNFVETNKIKLESEGIKDIKKFPSMFTED